MFTRSPVGEPMPLEPLKNADVSPSKPPQPRSGSTEPGKSVISNDLKILGQDLKIISRGTLARSRLTARSRATSPAQRSSSVRRRR